MGGRASRSPILAMQIPARKFITQLFEIEPRIATKTIATQYKSFLKLLIL